MERRKFMGIAAGAGAAAALTRCDRAETAATVTASGGTLAGKTLEELREEHRYWLLEDFLPFMDKYVIDHELGGFMCTVDRDGTRINTSKRAWYEGRGIWVYSYLYNKLDQNPEYLEIARKSADFISRHNPASPEIMPAGYTKEGAPTGNGPDPIFYGDVFVANGFQELAKATDNGQYRDTARKILFKCLDIYDNRPGYGNLKAGAANPALALGDVERPRMMGHWMVLLNLTQQMLETGPDPEVEKVADRCVDAVMNYHYNPDWGLLHEYMHHDLSRIENDYGQICVGHGPETLWMVLYEAVRRKDRALFDRAASYLKRSAEVFWDDVYGGMFHGLDHVEKNIWSVSQKSLWLQQEFLIGFLCVIEHTGAEWAKEWYGRLHEFVMRKFPLRQYGYPLWIAYADRKITFTPHYNRCENFHHPRYLMQNLLALDRMIERKGRVSGIFG